MSELNLNFATPQQGNMRDGIPIEKGVVLTEKYLEQHEDLFRQYSRYFMLYPDL